MLVGVVVHSRHLYTWLVVSGVVLACLCALGAPAAAFVVTTDASLVTTHLVESAVEEALRYRWLEMGVDSRPVAKAACVTAEETCGYDAKCLDTELGSRGIEVAVWVNVRWREREGTILLFTHTHGLVPAVLRLTEGHTVLDLPQIVRARLDVALDESSLARRGAIIVRAQPTGALVRAEGWRIAGDATDPTRWWVDPGSFSLQISADDYEPKSVAVDVRPGMAAEIRTSLDPVLAPWEHGAFWVIVGAAAVLASGIGTISAISGSRRHCACVGPAEQCACSN